MRVTLEELDGHVEMLVGKKKNMKFDPSKLLGLKRADVNYVLWGQSTAGQIKCTPLIEKEMDAWKVENEEAIQEDGRIVGQHRLGVEGRIRREEFTLQPESVQEHYTTLSKGGVVLTPEQQCVHLLERPRLHAHQEIFIGKSPPSPLSRISSTHAAGHRQWPIFMSSYLPQRLQQVTGSPW